MIDNAAKRETVTVRVGEVAIGSAHPVVVQSMTNTDTADAVSTAEQIYELWRAGSELVRITVNSKEAAEAVPKIHRSLKERGCDVPLIGDFHYNGHLLLKEYPDTARILAKYRINPGTLGGSSGRNLNFKTMVEVARDLQKAVRIGVNWGSLDQGVLAEKMDENSRRERPIEGVRVMQEALVESALRSAEMAESIGLSRESIILSAKVSRVPDLVDVYREIALRSDYSLHLGLTEAGMGDKGVIASTLGIGLLLSEGIGETIRVSLTPAPGESRSREVEVSQQILQSLNLRQFLPQITSCPGCGRTTSTFFQELSKDVHDYITSRMPEWRVQYPGVEELQIAVMGCVVNGPGESKHADIGISLPGTGETPQAPVFIDGKRDRTLRGPTLAKDFLALIEEYVMRKYGRE